MTFLHKVALLAIILPIHANAETGEPFAPLPRGNLPVAGSPHAVPSPTLDNELFWLLLKTLVDAMCVVIECGGGAALDDPTRLLDTTQELTEARMAAQIAAFNANGVLPSATIAQRAQALLDLAACRAHILATPGVVPQSLETDYLVMLDELEEALQP